MEPVLGSQPTDPEIASKFIAGKAGFEYPEDEADLLPESLEKGTTVFHRLNGEADRYCLMDYQIKGFLKAAAMALNGRNKMPKNFRSKIGKWLFVGPRQIEVQLPAGGELDYCERPLRAETMKGPRVSLARSEQLPANSSIEFWIEVVNDTELNEEVIKTLLDYGYYQGLGQWRGGGYGRFRYDVTAVEQ
jgi:hypothetical protein